MSPFHSKRRAPERLLTHPGRQLLLRRLLLPGSCPALPSNGNQLLWSKFQEEAATRKKQTRLEPTRPKMVVDLTSRAPWASLCAHCNALTAKWHTHHIMTVASCHDNNGKACTRLEKESCCQSRVQTTTRFSDNSWMSFPLVPVPSHLPPPSIYWLSPPELGSEADLRTRFPVLRSLATE